MLAKNTQISATDGAMSLLMVETDFEVYLKTTKFLCMILFCLGHVYLRCSTNCCPPNGAKVRGEIAQLSNSQQRLRAPESQCSDGLSLVKRRDVFGMVIGVSSLFFNSFEAEGAGLPPEEKPKLCDNACVKKLENVW